MNNNVSWTLEVAIKNGELESFQRLMREMVDATEANEPNTLNYEWFISEDDRSCHIYERYTDSAAALVHLGTFGEKYAERFLAVVDPTRLVVYGQPNSDAKAALAGFGAVFMSPLGGFAR